MEKEKNLKNFIFEQNCQVGTSVDDIVNELNAQPKFTENQVVPEDVKFGPEAEYSRVSRVGVYLHFEGISSKFNLKDAVDNLSEERYIEIFGVQISGSNKFTKYSVDELEIVGELSKQQGWEFEKISDEGSGIGYLTVEGFTYILKSVGSPSKLVLYAKDGEILDLSEGYEKHKQVIETIRKPIEENLAEEEKKNKVLDFSIRTWVDDPEAMDEDYDCGSYKYIPVESIIAELRHYNCFEETEEGIKLGDYFLAGRGADLNDDSMGSFEIVKESKSEETYTQFFSELEFRLTGYGYYGSLSLFTADKELARAEDIENTKIGKMLAYHVYVHIVQSHISIWDALVEFEYKRHNNSPGEKTVEETITAFMNQNLV